MRSTVNNEHIERREKGIHTKPLTFLLLEVCILMLVVFSISFANIANLTLIAGVGAVLYFIVSCIPRYKARKERQRPEVQH